MDARAIFAEALRAEIKGAVREVLVEFREDRSKRLYKIDEAANYLTLSIRAIQEEVAAGRLRMVKQNDNRRGRIMFDVRDLDQWIEERKR